MREIRCIDNSRRVISTASAIMGELDRILFRRKQMMTTYQVPQTPSVLTTRPNETFLLASGDLRLSANQVCWPAQAEMERQVLAAFTAERITVTRAHPYDDMQKHGFIWNQRMGMDIFKSIPPEAPLIVAVAVWAYRYHVLAG